MSALRHRPRRVAAPLAPRTSAERACRAGRPPPSPAGCGRRSRLSRTGAPPGRAGCAPWKAACSARAAGSGPSARGWREGRFRRTEMASHRIERSTSPGGERSGARASSSDAVQPRPPASAVRRRPLRLVRAAGGGGGGRDLLPVPARRRPRAAARLPSSTARREPIQRSIHQARGEHAAPRVDQHHPASGVRPEPWRWRRRLAACRQRMAAAAQRAGTRCPGAQVASRRR